MLIVDILNTIMLGVAKLNVVAPTVEPGAN